MDRIVAWVALMLFVGLLSSCSGPVDRPPPPENDGIYAFANGCYAIDATDPGSDDTRWLEPSETGEEFVFTARELDSGSRFFLKASDLGTYLLYDQEGRYLVAGEGRLLRQAALLSDILLVDDMYVSPAEWELQVSAHDDERFQLRHRQTGEFLTREGLSSDQSLAAVIALYPQTDCAEFPELTLDAEGEPEATSFEDGSLYGIVDAHTHLFTNLGFGGGGIFHGAPFHRLGVEHALPDCRLFHGRDGRSDLLGYGYDQARAGEVNTDALLGGLITGRTPEFNHHTAGYPEFTDWPSAHFSSTHQVQYYRWLQRAYMGGLRLIVQHATTNQAICELMVGANIQPVRYSCNDMVAVERSIAETYALERYIDAQEGGPGQGWFRIVTTPAGARDVIGQGKMAVILGIETSNLFDCFVAPREGFPTCDEAYVREQLDHYYELGVRAMFPVHKYDNAFSAGDGMKSVIELGNFVNSGYWSSFTQDCPAGVPTVFDQGDVAFGGLNMPREDYAGPPPNDMTGFGENPIGTIVPFLGRLMEGPLEGDYCQSHGLTPLGEYLIDEMMNRGMIIEVDHLPRRAYQRAFEILEANSYPAAGTHGLNYGGRLYAVGGMSKAELGRCHDPTEPGTTIRRLQSRFQLRGENGAYPAEGFGFDLNGFAGAPGPRFGEDSVCDEPQSNPVTYPFTSFDGSVTFTEPQVGNRTIDFNTEGLAHIGLLPELIEDSRRDGVPDEELEPLFRSAEAYIRMWELAEERAAAR